MIGQVYRGIIVERYSYCSSSFFRLADIIVNSNVSGSSTHRASFLPLPPSPPKNCHHCPRSRLPTPVPPIFIQLRASIVHQITQLHPIPKRASLHSPTHCPLATKITPPHGFFQHIPLGQRLHISMGGVAQPAPQRPKHSQKS
jgi:hypothetical protein